MSRVFGFLILILFSTVVFAEEAVIVVFPFANGDPDVSNDIKQVFALEDKLAIAIKKSGQGELDGNEVGQGEAIIYMYAPNASKLYESIKHVLAASPLTKQGYVRVRFGPPGATESRIELGKGS